MNMDPGYLAAALLAGMIGMGYLMYGKKSGDLQGLIIGAVISAESILCPTAVSLLVALFMTIAGHVVWRKISPT